MKIALCATHLEKMILPQDREYIGVDHGVEELLKQGITPKFAIGDFDSLQWRPHRAPGGRGAGRVNRPSARRIG